MDAMRLGQERLLTVKHQNLIGHSVLKKEKVEATSKLSELHVALLDTCHDCQQRQGDMQQNPDVKDHPMLRKVDLVTATRWNAYLRIHKRAPVIS